MTPSRDSQVLNFGSLNIDRVFRVPHIAAPGETIASTSLHEFAGGKGANQSVALARAGMWVAHAGKVGTDGKWLVDKLADNGVDTRWVLEGSGATGQAMIQVDDGGQNAIVLLPGTNREITPGEIGRAIANVSPGAWLLVQNETSSVADAMRLARARGMRVAFNPAPLDELVLGYPLELVDLLCINETEGAAMSGETMAERIARTLSNRLPRCEIVLTLGAAGAIYHGPEVQLHLAGTKVNAVDTTAAGDTFLGYFLASRIRELSPRESLVTASRAAMLCVGRPGAMDSIPRLDEVLAAG